MQLKIMPHTQAGQSIRRSSNRQNLSSWSVTSQASKLSISGPLLHVVQVLWKVTLNTFGMPPT
jgi:hypothetical protein